MTTAARGAPRLGRTALALPPFVRRVRARVAVARRSVRLPTVGARRVAATTIVEHAPRAIDRRGSTPLVRPVPAPSVALGASSARGRLATIVRRAARMETDPVLPPSGHLGASMPIGPHARRGPLRRVTPVGRARRELQVLVQVRQQARIVARGTTPTATVVPPPVIATAAAALHATMRRAGEQLVATIPAAPTTLGRAVARRAGPPTGRRATVCRPGASNGR